MGVRLPSGETKLFRSGAELVEFMRTYSGSSNEEDVPTTEPCANQRCGRCAALRFEEGETARRERAQRKFEARQTAKAQKRREKFIARQAENGATRATAPCAGTNSTRGGRRGNRK